MSDRVYHEVVIENVLATLEAARIVLQDVDLSRVDERVFRLEWLDEAIRELGGQ